jgi:hypothetical protein
MIDKLTCVSLSLHLRDRGHAVAKESGGTYWVSIRDGSGEPGAIYEGAEVMAIFTRSPEQSAMLVHALNMGMNYA